MYDSGVIVMMFFPLLGVTFNLCNASAPTPDAHAR